MLAITEVTPGPTSNLSESGGVFQAEKHALWLVSAALELVISSSLEGKAGLCFGHKNQEFKYPKPPIQTTN